MLILAPLRRLLARRPWLYWAVVAALALLAGGLVAQAAARVEAAKEAWGTTRAVVVAVVDIGPGDSLADATEVRRLPAPLVPVDGVEELDPAATARQRIATGEMIVTHDVAAIAGPQALLAAGWLAVAVAEPVPSGAGPGDEVSVASGGVVLAGDAVVVGTNGESLLIGVPAAAAAQVAQAAATGDVAVLIKP